jgi:uncharacterized protein YcbK (DUF882 family)
LTPDLHAAELRVHELEAALAAATASIEALEIFVVQLRPRADAVEHAEARALELQGKLEAEQARASALEAAVASATARSRDLEVQLVHTSTDAQQALQQQQAALQAALERQVAQVTEVRRNKVSFFAKSHSSRALVSATHTSRRVAVVSGCAVVDALWGMHDRGVEVVAMW